MRSETDAYLNIPVMLHTVVYWHHPRMGCVVQTTPNYTT